MESAPNWRTDFSSTISAESPTPNGAARRHGPCREGVKPSTLPRRDPGEHRRPDERVGEVDAVGRQRARRDSTDVVGTARSPTGGQEVANRVLLRLKQHQNPSSPSAESMRFSMRGTTSSAAR